MSAVVQAYATACSPTRQPARTWVAQAERRPRGAFQAGILTGGRYNHLALPTGNTTECTDCGLHPFGGLYAELLQPSRTTAFYGELSLSTFQGREAYTVSSSPAGYPQREYFTYRGTLGTARLGVRFLLPLPLDQHLVLGLGIEYNAVLGRRLPSNLGSTYTPTDASDAYPLPTFVPNLTLGWRHQRLTLLLDGRLYRANSGGFDFSDVFFTSTFAARLRASYRLGRNPDRAAPRP